MAAKYILAIVGVVFLLIAAVRLAKDRGRIGPAAKTWLIIGVIFVAVSLWSW
jgi:hypothetical protein